MTTPSPSFTVNSVAIPGEFAVAYGATVTLALASTSGLRGSPQWSIVGNDKSTRTNPTITPGGSPSGATATFTMPADPGDGLGMCFLVKCVVNNGTDLNGVAQSSYTATAVVGVLNAAGRLPFPYGEETERSAIYGYVEALNNIANSTAGGGDATSWRSVTLDNTTFTTPPYDGAVPHYDLAGAKWKVGGAHAIQINAIGTATSPGLTLRNTTAATAIASQDSPAAVLTAHVWVGGVDTQVDSAVRVTQDAASDVWRQFSAQVASGGWVDILGIGLTSGEFRWYEDGNARFKIADKTGAGNAKGFTFQSQLPSDGNGAGGRFTASAGVGVDKAGGSWSFVTGAPTGAGTAGAFAITGTAGTLFQATDAGAITIGAGTGIAHLSSGVLSASSIVNADVSVTADIAGTKISPAFGAQVISTSGGLNVTAGTGIGLGTTPASTGALRFSDSGSAYVWDSVGTTDRRIWDFNVTLSGGHTFGASGVPMQLRGTLLSATDGTYTHPILPTTTGTASTTAGGGAVASGTAVSLTAATVQRIGFAVCGRDTTGHKTYMSEAQLVCKTTGGTSYILVTSVASNPTTGAAPLYDGFGDMTGTVAYAISGNTVTVTVPGSAGSAISWTYRAWLITEGAI